MKNLSFVALGVITLMMLIGLFLESIELFLIMLPAFVTSFVIYRYGVDSINSVISKIPSRIKIFTKHKTIKNNTIIVFFKKSKDLKVSSIDSSIAGKITIKSISPDTLIKAASPMLQLSPIILLQKFLVSKLQPAIAESGQANNSRILVIHSITYAIFSAMACIPAGIILGIFLHILFLIICVIPGVILVYDLLYLKSLKMERKSAMDHELPIAVACASIMESINVTFFDFLIRLSKNTTTLFPVLKKDAMMFNRNIKFFGMSPTAALKDLAKNHPHKEFQEFIRDYISAYATSGISTANVVESKTNKFFRLLKFHIESYTNNANGISQMVLLAMIALPLLSIGSTFIATGDTAITLTISILLLLPIITMMIIVYTDSSQPKTQDSTKLSIHAAISAFATVLVTILLGLRMWEIFGITVVVFAAVNMAYNWKKFKDVADTDDSLESFLQNVTDNKESGIDIFASIKKIAANSTEYKTVFSDALLEISKKMTFGKTLSAASESSGLKSWLSRVVFFILAELHESGGANTRILRIMTAFVGQYTTDRKEMIMSLKGSLVIAYIIPVLMVMMLVISIQMTEKVSADIAGLESLPINFTINTLTRDFLDWSYLLVVECSVLVAIIMSKIAYFTVKHTLHVGVLTGVALGLCYMIPYLPSFL